jgi:phosphoglycerate dehydrogenase-like enzyme
MGQSRKPVSRVVVAVDCDETRKQALRSEFPEIEFVFTDSEHLAEQISGAHVLLGWSRLNDLLSNADDLVWVQNVGAGVERVVTDEFRARNLILTNGSGIMAPNMAEHAIGLMLALARRFPELLDAQRDRRWKTGVDTRNVTELGGQTVVLVGLGDIGLEIARRLTAFDMTVIGVRRSAGQPPEDVAEVGRMADLPELVGRADHVISSVPHTSETVGMFNAELFARFKDGARFYNLGRGTSVIQPDLIAVLESGKLSGAGLDVTDPEPLPADDPLWNAPNIMITAHTSGATPKFQDRLFDLFTDNLRRYIAGEELRNVVDQERGY